MHIRSSSCRLLTAVVACALTLQPLAAVAMPAKQSAPSRPAGRGSQAIAARILPAAADDDLPGIALTPSPVNGSLNDLGGDFDDIYHVTLTAGQKIIFGLTGDPGTDFGLDLYGPGGWDDYRDYAGGVAYPLSGSYVVPPGGGGEYYLDAYTMEGAGNYTLTYTIGAAAPDDGIPGVALPGSPVVDTLDAALDSEDIFSFSLTPGQRIHASVTGPAGTDFDLFVFKPGTTDTKVADPVAYAASEEYPDELTYTASSAGTYYLDVSAYEGAGAYQVDYTIGMAPAKTYASIKGTDRYQTAIAASKSAFPAGAPCVVIATGANWPDALGGAALAGAMGGPILLTAPGSLTPAVKTEITRLGATQAIILGSETAVSKAVYTAVDQLVGPVTRIGGSDRYSTADKVARKVALVLGEDFDGSCFIATGMNFPDALGASPLSAALRYPILLSSPKGLTSGTNSTMAAIRIGEAIILGSEDVVSQDVSDLLEDDDIWVKRLAGDNRYQTAAEIAAFGVEECGMTYDKVAIATGENFPDALAAGVMQGLDDSVMLLTPKAKLDSAPAAALRANKYQIDLVRFLGSTNALSNTARNQVKAALN